MPPTVMEASDLNGNFDALPHALRDHAETFERRKVDTGDAAQSAALERYCQRATCRRASRFCAGERTTCAAAEGQAPLFADL